MCRSETEQIVCYIWSRRQRKGGEEVSSAGWLLFGLPKSRSKRALFFAPESTNSSRVSFSLSALGLKVAAKGIPPGAEPCITHQPTTQNTLSVSMGLRVRHSHSDAHVSSVRTGQIFEALFSRAPSDADALNAGDYERRATFVCKTRHS